MIDNTIIVNVFVAEEGEEEVRLHLQEERGGGRCRLAAVRACREGAPFLPQNPGHNINIFKILYLRIVFILRKNVKAGFSQNALRLSKKVTLGDLQVLVGPPGVGRRALVQRIVAHNPKLFDTIKAGQYFLLLTEPHLEAQ